MNFKKNEIVLADVENDSTKGERWERAKIEELYKDAHGRDVARLYFFNYELFGHNVLVFPLYLIKKCEDQNDVK